MHERHLWYKLITKPERNPANHLQNSPTSGSKRIKTQYYWSLINHVKCYNAPSKHTKYTLWWSSYSVVSPNAERSKPSPIAALSMFEHVPHELVGKPHQLIAQPSAITSRYHSQEKCAKPTTQVQMQRFDCITSNCSQDALVHMSPSIICVFHSPYLLVCRILDS